MKGKRLAGHLLLASLLMLLLFSRLLPAPQAQPALVLACRAGVHFTIEEASGVTTMAGRLTLNTLGATRLALRFSGQLKTPEGDYRLNRIVMMRYRYFVENHTLELNYLDSHHSSTDTTPDAVFYQRLFRSRALLLYLTRFNDRSWLVSGLNMPLYLCSDSGN